MTEREASRFMDCGYIYSIPYDRVIPTRAMKPDGSNNELLLICRDRNRDYSFVDADSIRQSNRQEYVRQEATRRVEQTLNVSGGVVNINFSF